MNVGGAFAGAPVEMLGEALSNATVYAWARACMAAGACPPEVGSI
ncbi:MAG: hypothetical protein OEZ04_09415 [Nitrospinota bacterium]|nr:hypothetical protein [Nitrospinota bacterium]